MSKKHLEYVIADINFWHKLKGKPLMDIDNLTQAHADELYEKIDTQLSPENLHCDGEATPAQVRRSLIMLRGAADTLEALGFSVPGSCYELA